MCVLVEREKERERERGRGKSFMLNAFFCVFVFLLTHYSLMHHSFANIIGADTQNFNPNYSYDDFVTVGSSNTLDPGYLSITLFADYSEGTLPAYPFDESPTVERRADLGDTAIYTHFGIGFGLSDRLDMGISIPVIVDQEVDSPNPRGQFTQDGEGTVEIRAAAKARLVDFKGGGGIAFQTSVGFNQVKNNPFIGKDPGPTINFELIADQKNGRLHLAGNLGYRMRDPGEPSEFFETALTTVPIEPNDDIALASVALSYQMNNNWNLIGEFWGAWPNGDFGGVAVYRDIESYEGLLGLKYKWSDRLNLHIGSTMGINNGISVPEYRVYAGLNCMFGPLWDTNPTKRIVKAERIDDTLSYYDPGFRQGYMAGYGIGRYAGLGPDYGEALRGGVEYPEGYYDGYVASGNPFPDEVIAQTPYSKCYRMGFQGKIGNGPADGQGLGYGEVLGLGVECSEGYDQGWGDALDSNQGKDSYYNQGYREGYKAGYGIGPYVGLGPSHGKTLDGGFEFDRGYYEGYSDVDGPFPGSQTTRPYGKGYRNGFQGKLGQGPGKGTGANFGATVNPREPFPLGWEHGWIDAPNENPEPDPLTFDAGDGGAFDDLQAKAEESFRIENILFNLNSYKIRERSFPALGSLARHLQKAGGFEILLIEGHTDSLGGSMYNEKLSIQRAMSVKKFLVQVHGIAEEKIVVDGWGERKPVVPNNSKTNRRRNRRVEFKISR